MEHDGVITIYDETGDVRAQYEGLAVHHVGAFVDLVDGRLTKKDISNAAIRIAGEVLAGRDPALMTYIRLKAIQEVCKQALEEIKPDAMREAAMNKGDTFLGVSYQVKAGQTKWEYTDSTLASLESQIEELKNAADARRKMLQSLPPGGLVDPETGEFVEAAEASYGDGTIAITFAKE